MYDDIYIYSTSNTCVLCTNYVYLFNISQIMYFLIVHAVCYLKDITFSPMLVLEVVQIQVTWAWRIKLN